MAECCRADALPEQAVLKFFRPRISRGGIVLIDDFAYYENESLASAIDSFAARPGLRVLWLPTGQGLILK